MKTLLRDEFAFLLFSELYTKFSEVGARRKSFSILEAAIASIGRKGLDNVTLKMIAREAGITPQLINHYFKNLSELKVFTAKYVRLLFQKFVLDRMQNARDHEERLRLYVEACFEWVVNFRNHALVWLTILHRCASSTELRLLNTEAVQTGESRLAALLDRGMKDGAFSFNSAADTARSIQVLITGALLSAVSEEHSDFKAFSTLVVERCLAIAGAKSRL